MDSQPLVSIIIVNLNRKKELTNCIESLNFQNYKNYEILLIDNNSVDGSAEYINSKFPKLFKQIQNCIFFIKNSRGAESCYLESEM